MPLPQLSKLWQFDVNQTYNRGTDETATSMYRKILWDQGVARHDAWRAGGDGQRWTVARSSGGAGDSLAAGPEDHWTSEAALRAQRRVGA
ncbi:MAG: hypothetical protein U0359_42185 [Byssovorax sp.]